MISFPKDTRIFDKMKIEEEKAEFE